MKKIIFVLLMIAILFTMCIFVSFAQDYMGKGGVIISSSEGRVWNSFTTPQKTAFTVGVLQILYLANLEDDTVEAGMLIVIMEKMTIDDLSGIVMEVELAYQKSYNLDILIAEMVVRELLEFTNLETILYW